MEGAVRIFAHEFSQATFTVPDGDDRNAAWIVTPSGAYCRQVFIAGALTEAHENGDMVYARLADPTGGFDLSCGGKSSQVADLIRKISLPSFVSVVGRAQFFVKSGAVILSIRPEHIRVIDRKARDQWVLKTSHDTLLRLESARLAIRGESTDERMIAAIRQYAITPARLDDLAAMVENAIMNVKPTETTPVTQVDVRELVMDLLKSNGGPRGIAVQEIIDTLAVHGVFQDVVLSTIDALIVEDECYQPQKGFIRLL